MKKKNLLIQAWFFFFYHIVNFKCCNYLQAAKRQPGTSGRLHRTVTGEWVWSSEEEGGMSSDEEVRIDNFNIEQNFLYYSNL